MQKYIDPRVLMTVLAFQGDRENCERERNNNDRSAHLQASPALEIRPQQLSTILEKITELSKRSRR